MPNRRDRPLYKEAVYGIKKIKIITEAPTFNGLLPKRSPKNWGIVAESKCCVIMRVLRPNTAHANREPIIAFPIPAHVAAIPNFQPNCPAYPTNTTAEKYDVP